MNGLSTKSPDGLLAFINLNETFGFNNFADRVKNNNWRVGELVIHPATKIDSVYQGKMTDSRLNEYKLFSNDKMKEYIVSKYKLVSYKDV